MMTTKRRHQMIGALVCAALGVIFLPGLLTHSPRAISTAQLTHDIPSSPAKPDVSTSFVNTQMAANDTNAAAPATQSATSAGNTADANAQTGMPDSASDPFDQKVDDQSKPMPDQDANALMNSVNDAKEPTQAPAPAPAPQTNAAPQVTVPAPSTSAPATPATPSEPSAPSMTLPDAAPAPAATPAPSKPVSAAPVQIKPATLVPAPAKRAAEQVVIKSPAKIISRKHAAAPAGWSVQLGTFSNAENAKALTHKLRKLGFKAYTRSMKNAQYGSMIKVLVGPEIKESQAIAIRNKLRDDFRINGEIIHYEA